MDGDSVGLSLIGLLVGLLLVGSIDGDNVGLSLVGLFVGLLLMGSIDGEGVGLSLVGNEVGEFVVGCAVVGSMEDGVMDGSVDMMNDGWNESDGILDF
jgi:hypothetical protein